MSGGFGCATWARAHASNRSAKAPSSSARFHSNPSGKWLAGRSAVLHRLPIAQAIGRALRLASHPGQTLVQLQKDVEQVLMTSSRAPANLSGASALHAKTASSAHLISATSYQNRSNEKAPRRALGTVSGAAAPSLSVAGRSNPSGTRPPSVLPGDLREWPTPPATGHGGCRPQRTPWARW